MSSVPTCEILGVPFSTLSFEDTIALLQNWLEASTPHQVITANPEIVMYARRDATLWRVLQQADLVTPDGIGAVYAARLFGQPVAGRVTGAELLPRLFDLANQKGWPVYILGASPNSSRRALEKLAQLYPQISFSGRDGYFSEQEVPEILAEIQRQAPRLLLVGLNIGRQETFIAHHLHDLNVPVSIGIGGMIDVFAGTVKRAPVVWQKLNLEWLYRLLKQPSRWRRQLVLPQFALAVLKERFLARGKEK